MLKAVNDFTKKKYEGDDVREGLVGAVAIRLKDPVFESQTKNKLGNTEIRGDLVKKVQDIVSDLLHRNPEAAEKIVCQGGGHGAAAAGVGEREKAGARAQRGDRPCVSRS